MCIQITLETERKQPIALYIEREEQREEQREESKQFTFVSDLPPQVLIEMEVAAHVCSIWPHFFDSIDNSFLKVSKNNLFVKNNVKL